MLQKVFRRVRVAWKKETAGPGSKFPNFGRQKNSLVGLPPPNTRSAQGISESKYAPDLETTSL